MRKNTAQVLESLRRGKAKRSCEAVHTDGQIVTSYRTPVAVPDPSDPNHWLVTEHGAHSVTTTVQTNGLAMGLQYDMGKSVTRVAQRVIDDIVRNHY